MCAKERNNKHIVTLLMSVMGERRVPDNIVTQYQQLLSRGLGAIDRKDTSYSEDELPPHVVGLMLSMEDAVSEESISNIRGAVEDLSDQIDTEIALGAEHTVTKYAIHTKTHDSSINNLHDFAREVRIGFEEIHKK